MNIEEERIRRAAVNLPKTKCPLCQREVGISTRGALLEHLAFGVFAGVPRGCSASGHTLAVVEGWLMRPERLASGSER
jgi:hypothetical protein